jgi:hypothetical protein
MRIDTTLLGLGAVLLLAGPASAAPPGDAPPAAASPEALGPIRDPAFEALPKEPSHPLRGKGPAIVAGIGYGLIGLGVLSGAGAAYAQYKGAHSGCDACFYPIVTAGLAAHGGACLISGIVMAVAGTRKMSPVALAPLVVSPVRAGTARPAPPAGAALTFAF